jgi:hypothetical protein
MRDAEKIEASLIGNRPNSYPIVDSSGFKTDSYRFSFKKLDEEECMGNN